MKIGFQLVLYVLLLNLVSGLMYTAAVPGTEFSNILSGVGDPDAYAERFNSTEFMESTEPEAAIIFTFVGHIWTALNVVWNAIRFTIWGFPTLLSTIGGQITDPSAKAVYTSISSILYVVFSFIIFMWLYQLLTGREVQT